MNIFKPPKLLKEFPAFLKLLIFIAILSALIIIGLYFCKFHHVLANTQDTWGQFGDYVGGTLNPVFSFFTLIAVLITIKQQSEQIRSLEKTSTLQRFESNFFQILTLFYEVKREMVIIIDATFENGKTTPKDIRFEGLACLTKLSNQMFERLKSCKTENDLKIQYLNFYKNYSFLLKHYFQTLQNIIEFIEKSDVYDKDFID
jgi:uncharacterized membrane protein